MGERTNPRKSLGLKSFPKNPSGPGGLHRRCYFASIFTMQLRWCFRCLQKRDVNISSLSYFGNFQTTFKQQQRCPKIHHMTLFFLLVRNQDQLRQNRRFGVGGRNTQVEFQAQRHHARVETFQMATGAVGNVAMAILAGVS